jgi:hypothetical protein
MNSHKIPKQLNKIRLKKSPKMSQQWNHKTDSNNFQTINQPIIDSTQ